MPRMPTLFTIALALALPAAASAEKPLSPPEAAARGADWSPDRATGPKDVSALGDSVNAWATASADAGAEWLKLGYAEAVPIKEIRIWQNDAPGAIARVTVTVDGAEVEVWKGQDPPSEKPPTGPVEKVVTLAKPYISDTVTVHLDTTRVSGWNEIDAVQIVAADGREAWARSASASSTYATLSGSSAHPLGHLVDKQVTIRAAGAVVTGTVTAIDYTWITLQVGPKTVLVNQQHAATIEWRD